MSEESTIPVASQSMPTTNRGPLFKALAKAQSAFKPVTKNKKAAYGKYADLTETLNAVRPALNENGLFLYQDVRSVREGVIVKTIIAHESGEALESGELFMPVGASGKINAAQAFGSARTYACRYSLSSFLGIAADDDDDGNASGSPMQQSQPQKRPASRSPYNIPLEDIPY